MASNLQNTEIHTVRKQIQQVKKCWKLSEKRKNQKKFFEN
jgi:flagellin-specific chaperone FliS